MILNSFVFILAVYIIFEAVDDANRYSGFDHACLVARDVLTGLAGVMLGWYAIKDTTLILISGAPWNSQLDWLHLVLAVTLALYIWPKMVIRAVKFWPKIRLRVKGWRP